MSDPNNRGVLVDIGQMERMLASPPGSPSTSAGILMSVPVVVTFGSTPDGQRWEFTGTITQCTVQYLMFSHNMIPTVAQADISLTRRYYNATASGAAGSASSPSSAAPSPSPTPHHVR